VDFSLLYLIRAVVVAILGATQHFNSNTSSNSRQLEIHIFFTIYQFN